MQYERYAFKSIHYSGILMVSVNTNMSYKQTTVGVQEPLLRGSAAVVSLRLLCLSSITFRYDILGRIHLVEGSARPRDLYLTTHNTHETHIYAPAGFEHTNPASQRSWTLALDHVAPGGEPSHWFSILHSCGILRNIFDRAYCLLSVSRLSVCVLPCRIVSRQ